MSGNGLEHLRCYLRLLRNIRYVYVKDNRIMAGARVSCTRYHSLGSTVLLLYRTVGGYLGIRWVSPLPIYMCILWVIISGHPCTVVIIIGRKSRYLIRSRKFVIRFNKDSTRTGFRYSRCAPCHILISRYWGRFRCFAPGGPFGCPHGKYMGKALKTSIWSRNSKMLLPARIYHLGIGDILTLWGCKTAISRNGDNPT